jgi:hypothetical protein
LEGVFIHFLYKNFMKISRSRVAYAAHAAFVATSAFAVLFGPSAALAASLIKYPSGDGAYSQWAPSSGTDHFRMVNEVTCNGTTDYIYYPDLSVSSVKDSFTLDISSIPNGSTITKIVITPCASRNDTDVSTSTILDVFYRKDGVNSSLEGDYVLSGTTPTTLGATVWNVNFTKNAGTTIQSGVSFSGGSAGARVSNLRTVIHYQ